MLKQVGGGNCKPASPISQHTVTKREVQKQLANTQGLNLRGQGGRTSLGVDLDQKDSPVVSQKNCMKPLQQNRNKTKKGGMDLKEVVECAVERKGCMCCAIKKNKEGASKK